MLHVPTALKCGSPSLLELSGPVQSLMGIALPFTWKLQLENKRQLLEVEESSCLSRY